MKNLSTIKAAVKIARKNAKPNVINVNDIITASLFVSGGTLGNEDIENIKLYLLENRSQYELFCGYVQTKKTASHYTHLFVEHSHFHVQKFTNTNEHLEWEVFDKLTEAKAFFKKCIKA